MDRHPDDLLKDALAVIDRVCVEHSVWGLVPLFSGGHDSYCACYVASKHKRFKGEVFHIDTGIGSEKTKRFVQQVCDDEGWRLRVYKSTNPNDSYEALIRRAGFPGPSMHGTCYQRLKDRSVDKITSCRSKLILSRWALVTGCRSAESTRRMGHVEPIKTDPRTQSRVWVAPLHDWTGEDQTTFMNYHRLDRNPVKMSPLAMSGECFCGAFARPDEYELVKQFVPDVAAEIDRLSHIAKKCGKHSTWGTRPPKDGETGLVISETGPLCNSCDLKMASMGVKIIPQS